MSMWKLFAAKEKKGKVITRWAIVLEREMVKMVIILNNQEVGCERIQQKHSIIFL